MPTSPQTADLDEVEAADLAGHSAAGSALVSDKALPLDHPARADWSARGLLSVIAAGQPVTYSSSRTS
jgi:hypothetical protein